MLYFRIDTLLQYSRIGADARNDGLQVILIRRKDGIQQMERLRGSCFMLRCDVHCRFKRLLGSHC